MSQVIDDDQSCQAAVTRVMTYRAGRGEPVPSANTAAYCKARMRLPEELISGLTRQSGRDLEEVAPPQWQWRERPMKLVDGSTVTMPDTPENQAAYPQPRSQKPGIGFPIARVVGILSGTTGALLDFNMGPYRGKGTGEHGLLRPMMDHFHSGDVALGDCYYASFFLIADLMRRGVDAVFPMHGARDCDFRTGHRLGKKDHRVTWVKPQRPAWMDQNSYDLFPDEIIVREVEVQINRPGFRAESQVLATTFLKPKITTKQELMELYGRRWCVELDLRSIKQTMHMDILRGKTPEMVRKEIWAHLLAYNLIRKVMAQAASVYNKTPRQLSFKLALQTVESFRQANLFCESRKDCYDQILKAIASKTVGNRPGRREPRRVKRRPKPFARLQKRRDLYRQEAA